MILKMILFFIRKFIIKHKASPAIIAVQTLLYHNPESNQASTIALMKADPKPGTTKADRLELLTVLVSHYEDTYYPI